MGYKLLYEAEAEVKTRLKSDFFVRAMGGLPIKDEIIDNPKDKLNVDIALLRIVYEQLEEGIILEKENRGITRADEITELNITIKNLTTQIWDWSAEDEEYAAHVAKMKELYGDIPALDD